MKPDIHQYTPAITLGDGVSNSLFFIKKILTALDYKSEIYSDNIHPELKNLVHPRKTYSDNGNNILLLHHAAAQPDPKWFYDLRDQLVMIYHNITPSHYFNESTPHLNATKVGREQLSGWQDLFAGIIADSEYNFRELKGLGYHNIHKIPLLIDFEKANKIRADQKIIHKHEKTFNLLFVGRIAENKCQHDLIHALARLQDKNVHLFCVGGISSHGYQQYLEELVSSYHLQEQVHLTGRVSDEILWGYYKSADLFVCLSDHEGFGIPLIEASSIGLPVVAYDSSNIRYTLAGTGLLLSYKNSFDVAAVWQRLIAQPEWRYRLAQSQKANMSRFTFETLKNQLKIFLDSLTPEKKNLLPQYKKKILAKKKHLLQISIEGPFDSNYSLALVNRELALALANRGLQVDLHSTEGGGDYTPDLQFINDYPKIKELWSGGIRKQRADIAIRNLFPPRVSGMNGEKKVLGPYGWEESIFPREWIDSFNQRLHLVATMSDYVTRTLRNNGVTAPMSTTGIGADHLKDVPAGSLPFSFPQGYTLLHISSCFPRKGVDLLLRAFLAAYDGKSYNNKIETTLIIKTFPNSHNNIRQQIDEAGWIKESRFLFGRGQDFVKKDAVKKRILLLEEDLAPGQIVSLYQQSDLFIAPSRGEGFGLPMAEAMLFDLPVLTTGYGGQVDFCTSETSWLIDYKFAWAKTHLKLSDSVWAEPDFDDLIKKMEQIAALSLEKIKQKTDRARENILRHYSWEQVAKRLHNAIENLNRQICPKSEPCIGWVSTWNTHCGIASYSKHLIKALSVKRVVILANHTHQLIKPDLTYVLRCWETGGKDNLHQLLKTIIAQKITDFVIQFNFSFFKLQALSELLMALKKQKVRSYLFLHSTADVLPPHEPKSLSTIKPALCQAERLFVHSIHDLNFLKEIGIIDNVILFPHGVDKCPDPEADLKFGLSVSIPRQKSKFIASYGFLLPNKGIIELISAFEILRRDEPELKLLLLNALYPGKISEQEQNQCRKKIEQSQYRNDISMINEYLAEKEIYQKLSQAEVIVYPCQDTQESSSASVRMGLATGRPVAVTPLAIFEDVVDVVYTLPGIRPEDIAEGIKKIINNNTAQLDKIMTRQQTWLKSHDWRILGKQLQLIICHKL